MTAPLPPSTEAALRVAIQTALTSWWGPNPASNTRAKLGEHLLTAVLAVLPKQSDLVNSDDNNVTSDLKALLAMPHTPFPWIVRENRGDSFVEAKVEGKPFGQEILGDDYWAHLSRSDDVKFVAAVMAYLNAQ